MALIVELTEEEMRVAAGVGVERRLRALARHRAHRWEWNGEGVWAIDILAAGAEEAVAKLLGRYWTDTADPDSAGDVGDRTQVRWTPRNDGCLILHPEDPDDHYFFLVIGVMPVYTIAGYIRAGAGKQDAYWRADLPRPAYFVPQTALRPYEVTP
jgi:hypothetical protein